MLFHMCSKEVWEHSKDESFYRDDTLAEEGFIHCVESGQLLGVANTAFRGRHDLVLLVIDPWKVDSKIVYEPSHDGENFPHIHGPVNRDAIVAAIDFTPKKDGTFAMPKF